MRGGKRFKCQGFEIGVKGQGLRLWLRVSGLGFGIRVRTPKTSKQGPENQIKQNRRCRWSS